MTVKSFIKNWWQVILVAVCLVAATFGFMHHPPTIPISLTHHNNGYFQCDEYFALTTDEVDLIKDRFNCTSWDFHSYDEVESLTPFRVAQQRACLGLEVSLCEKGTECGIYASNWACMNALDEDGFCLDLSDEDPAKIWKCADATDQINCSRPITPEECKAF